MNLRNPKEYCESLLVIRNKKQELVPLRFNEAQSNLYAVIRQQAALGKPIRIIILKGRQEGISTVTGGVDVSGHRDPAQREDPDRGP